ncbi:MAG: hypothetical protein FIA99_08325 [Ruminiclostridium sp.]|nr:hypothetical protein [Ruminiclostridium sp.]
MQNQKVLDIIPFNDIFYKSCFYNPFFTAVIYFKDSIIPFLANDFFIYRYNRKNKCDINFRLMIENAEPESKILEYMGICLNTKIFCTDLIEDIQQSILNNRPVLLVIDDYFKHPERHWPHAYLAYGFDNINKICNIIDIPANLCIKSEILYTDLVTAHNDYHAHFNKNMDIITYKEIFSCDDSWKDKTNINKFRSAYANNLLKIKGKLYIGLKDLLIFTDDYENIVLDEALFKTYAKELVKILKWITVEKESQKYGLQKLFGNEPVFMGVLEAIIDYWSFIKAIMFKYNFSSVYKIESLSATIKKIRQIYDLEYDYLEKVFSYFEKYYCDVQ